MKKPGEKPLHFVYPGLEACRRKNNFKMYLFCFSLSYRSTLNVKSINSIGTHKLSMCSFQKKRPIWRCVSALRSPTLTDGLRTTPGAVALAGPLGRANQTVSRLAAKTQQALGFKLFPSQPRAVGRHSRVAAHSWTDTYLKMRRRVNGTNRQRQDGESSHQCGN